MGFRAVFTSVVGILFLFAAVVLSQSTRLHFNCTEPGKAAITFDDGPDREKTRILLDVLKENNVSATFFVTGIRPGGGFEPNETRYRETVKRIYDEGHQIGSHTWSHPDLELTSEEDMRKELNQLSDFIYDILQLNMTVMRPPYGHYTDSVLQIAQDEFDYDVIIWNVDTEDWYYKENTTMEIQAWKDAVAQHGNTESYIGLHHDPSSGHTDLTQMTIDVLRSANITITTIADCINKPMYRYPEDLY